MEKHFNLYGAKPKSIISFYWWCLFKPYKARFMAWRVMQGMIWGSAYEYAKELTKDDFKKYEPYILEMEKGLTTNKKEQ